jgi:hypothetical protein
MSTTVRITDLLSTFGNPSIKSMDISAHSFHGTSRGCNKPVGCKCSDLLRRQMVYPWTNSLTRAAACGQ